MTLKNLAISFGGTGIAFLALLILAAIIPTAFIDYIKANNLTWIEAQGLLMLTIVGFIGFVAFIATSIQLYLHLEEKK